ncbi:tRNA (guanosine(46)-N7)-methyltransferase TrmB [Nocardioides sp. LS1]|uniref:tRNA (guanosine(46)-N7)-methyltransferase TrmB n=1 Tax=Nocardioides sp. LS1 TaxID=1027620 RepID=UPI000F61B3E5|nr:tRNA (guanosine(46)-N7)-methyltransferase TrmB [Nocardioides sp. LS1]GCD92018.1 tRNA (guanine-N(7)-)-methyltransferase [Nocardioides sp. LS1]
MNERVRPARPHHKLTEDGRPMREVLSYSRRGSRFTPNQQAAWDAHHEAWWVPDDVVDRDDFDLTAWFGREAPLVVEIGCGIGESTAALAATRPGTNVLGIEVWVPGIADTLGKVGEAGLDNVRMIGVDAAWSMEHLFEPGSLAGVWTFFPDPWHKKKHNKRRLVNAAFAAVVASRLEVGAEWRLATDWADYAEQMVEVLDAEPLLEGGVTERWDERPLTRFERKGLDKGRDITDLCYRRV